jgi:hypothetical protein
VTSTPIAGGLDWELADLGDAAVRQELDQSVTEITAGRACLYHDLAWLLEAEGRNPDDVQVYVCRTGHRLRAYAPFVAQSWAMRFRIGELTLFSVVFQRLHITSGPILGADSGEVTAAAVESLFARLRAAMKRRQVIYLEGVAVGSDVERAVIAESTRKMFRVMEPSARYERRLIRFPSTFDEYIGSIKYQTRQNLRNSQKKLYKHLSGSVKLVRCTDPDQIPDFVTRAVAISQKTYQWHLLGLGLRKPDELRETLTAMARHGWTRCYLLECDGAATAFMIGYLYSGVYYYVDVGFDPAWEKWSVGTVLQMEVLRDLMDGGERVESFDFSSGSGVHKKRFSNESRPEANYLLIPRDFRSGILVGAFRCTDALSKTAVGLLERLRLKAAIKKLIRRSASDKAPAD